MTILPQHASVETVDFKSLCQLTVLFRFGGIFDNIGQPHSGHSINEGLVFLRIIFRFRGLFLLSGKGKANSDRIKSQLNFVDFDFIAILLLLT